MSKNIAALLLAFGLLSASFAPVVSLAAQCGDLDSNGVVIQCGNGSPELVVNGFGVMNSQVPHVAAGVTVADAAGFTSTCPAWFGTQMYCVDIFGTDIYKNQARFTAKQLQANGFLSQFPKYAYWLTH